MTDVSTGNNVVEFSRLFRLAEFDEAPEHKIEIVATSAECDALAVRYSILSLDSLKAQLTIRRDVMGEIFVEGHLQAEATQQCVVTLEPVREAISAPLDQRYTLRPADLAADFADDIDDIDQPEPVIGDAIDLGELVAQYLSLSLDPYPRAPDADAEIDEFQANTPNDGPFAALAKLRQES